MSIKLQALSYFWPRLSIFPYAGWQVELHLSTLRNMSYNNDCLWRPFRVIESSDWDNRLLNFIAGLGWQVTAFISSGGEMEIKTLISNQQTGIYQLPIYTFSFPFSSEQLNQELLQHSHISSVVRGFSEERKMGKICAASLEVRSRERTRHMPYSSTGFSASCCF